jgi:hypothetical protein
MSRAQTVFACAIAAMIALVETAHAQKLTDLEAIGQLCASETEAMEQKLLRCADYRADRKKFADTIGKTFVEICQAVKRQCRGRHNARMHQLSTGLGCAERDFCYYVRR